MRANTALFFRKVLLGICVGVFFAASFHTGWALLLGISLAAFASALPNIIRTWIPMYRRHCRATRFTKRYLVETWDRAPSVDLTSYSFYDKIPVLHLELPFKDEVATVLLIHGNSLQARFLLERFEEFRATDAEISVNATIAHFLFAVSFKRWLKILDPVRIWAEGDIVEFKSAIADHMRSKLKMR